MSRLDDAVGRILRLKFALGLFKQPYVEERPRQERILLPEYRQPADSLAEGSVVLLKNKGNLLPLDGNKKSIALIGPMVTNQEDVLGWWWGQGVADDVCTVLNAVNQEFNGKARARMWKVAISKKPGATHLHRRWKPPVRPMP